MEVSDNYRECGCNSGGWIGNGVYYGGWEVEQCNICACWGGAMAGYKSKGQQKGSIESLGLRITIEVCGSGCDSDLSVDPDFDFRANSNHYHYTLNLGPYSIDSIYILISLLIVNIICLITFCYKQYASNQQIRYKPASIDSEASI